MVDKKVVKKPVAAKTDDKPNVERTASEVWNLNRLFWGLLLVMIGSLILLDNLGIVQVNLANIWQLWPLLIIGWGVSLIQIPGMAWRIVLAALMVASLGFVAWAAIAQGDAFINNRQAASRNYSEQVSVDSNAVKSLDVTLESGAGDVTLGPTDASAVEVSLESGFANLTHQSQVDGTVQQVLISTRNNGTMMWNGNMHNELTVRLPRDVETDLSVKLGASDVTANLKDVRVRTFSLDTGATSADLTLGSLVDDMSMELSAGASSIVVRVPKESGVRVVMDKGLSSQSLGNLSAKGNGVYESDNYETAKKTVHITGDLGLASLELVRY